MSEPVRLYVYDLSQGLAKTMSLALTGKQIDGIWHTAVVVYGQEIYYGQGIMTTVPGTTQHGAPLQVIDIGETYLPQEVVTEYVDSLRSVFTAEKYHLLDFNCNTFSNDLCQFLCGKDIPDHITGLPAHVMNTPFGQSILPMIENMFGQSQIRPSAPIAPAPSQNILPESILQGLASAAMSAGPIKKQPIQEAKSAQVMEQYVAEYQAVVVMFTSSTCGPCQMIKPKFKELIEEKNSQGQTIRVLGVLLDASLAHNYPVRGVPTFYFYLNGKKYSEFSGADYTELKSQLDILLFEAYPPHPHRKVLLKNIPYQSTVPILYKNTGKLDMIYDKLNGFLQHVDLTETEKKTLQETRKYLEGEKTLDVSLWSQLVEVLLTKLSCDQYFPVLDIFKSLMLYPQVSHFYTTNPAQLGTILELVEKNQESMGRATWIMILRVACNLFSDSTLSTTHFTSHLGASYRSQLTGLLISSLLSTDGQIRQAAASLAYNCSNNVSIERLKKEEGTWTGIAEQEDDDWLVELVSAVTDALSKEKDQEIVNRLLATISKLLFLAPTESSVNSLLSALDFENIVKTKEGLKNDQLGNDICKLIQIE